MNVNLNNNAHTISQDLDRKMKEALTDVTLDVRRVASQSAPHDSGFLEGNAQYHVDTAGGVLKGTVGFSAENKGFDYAKAMNDKHYKLGEKSARKTGGRSAIGGGATVPVGTGFLSNAIDFNRPGYMQYLQNKFREGLQ